MVDAFKPAGGRQVIIQFSGLLNIGEEYDLPGEHFSQGSVCRIERVIGQASGQTRYLATMLSGRMLHVDSHASVERVPRNRRPAGPEQGTEGGGGAPAGSPMDWNAFANLEDEDQRKVAEEFIQGQEAQGDEERLVLRPEHYARAMGREVDDQEFMVDDSAEPPTASGKEGEVKPVDGGRRSRYKDKWVRGTDGNLYRTEQQAENPFKPKPKTTNSSTNGESAVKFGVMVRPKSPKVDGNGK